MEKLLNKYLNEVDLEKLQYATLACYNNIFSDLELIRELESELPQEAKMEDISLRYQNTSIVINTEDKDLYVNFDLYLSEVKIGYLKGWYDVKGNYIDDFLVFEKVM